LDEDEKKKEEELNTHGPVKDRGCTDLICCLFFLLFIFAEIVIAGVSFSSGQPDLLLYPYDEDGNPCGKPNEKAANYSYLYLYNALVKAKSLNYNFTSQGLCVSECPAAYPPLGQSELVLKCVPTTNNPNCSCKRENVFLSEPCKL